MNAPRRRQQNFPSSSAAIPFHFDFDVEVFEKSGEDPSKERRIGGFVTTDKLDQQGERLIQEGLNFDPFLTKGWFNDNHSKDTTGIIGYPEAAQLVSRGERLPNGKVAEKKGWYVEGFLLKGTKRADETWELANALQKSKRKLGFSVEGSIQQRAKINGVPHVAAAVVRNVAITNCPVNDDTALEVIAKSLSAMDEANGVSLEKALGVGPASAPGVAHGVGLVGASAGRVLTTQSLEGAAPRKKKRKRGLNKAEGVHLILTRWPHISAQTAERIYLHAAAKRRQA